MMSRFVINDENRNQFPDPVGTINIGEVSWQIAVIFVSAACGRVGGSLVAQLYRAPI